MEIKQLQLIHYRNYEKSSFEFSEGTNIIFGKNGQGKTNLLESVFVLCRGYSHRSGRLADLIRFGDDSMGISSSFKTGSTSHRLRLTVIQGRKKWELDGKTESGFAKIGRLAGCILFEPDDLEIVKSGPERRRAFINEELSGLNPVYRATYRTFEKVRSQRNALLKDIRFKKIPADQARALLAPWDQQLTNAAENVFRERAEYLLKLNREAKKLHERLSGTGEKLSLEYQSNVFSGFDELPRIRQVYLHKLEENLTSDIERGYTAAGPHADELVVKIDGVPARQFASQGQQRTAAISLKLAHIALYREKNGEAPVVLLDDILSELDEGRQRNLLSVLSGVQSFITCTDPAFADVIAEGTARVCEEGSGQDIRKFRINSGELIPKPAAAYNEPAAVHSAMKYSKESN